VVFFKPGFLFYGVFKPSIIFKKLLLPGGMPIEVDLAVLPEKKKKKNPCLRLISLILFSVNFICPN